jgi:hypothetical protein
MKDPQQQIINMLLEHLIDPIEASDTDCTRLRKVEARRVLMAAQGLLKQYFDGTIDYQFLDYIIAKSKE